MPDLVDLVHGILVGPKFYEKFLRVSNTMGLVSKNILPKNYLGCPREILDYGPKFQKFWDWAYIGCEGPT